MKKYIFILFTTALLSSCVKERRCWIMNDCLGNDVGSFCGSESEVQDECQSHSTPGCPWGYRRE